MSKPPAHRICQACRQLESKENLLRLVRVQNGEVFFIDPQNLDLGRRRAEGRSYHWHRECTDKALIVKKVAHFLRADADEKLRRLLIEVKEKLTID